MKIAAVPAVSLITLLALASTFAAETQHAAELARLREQQVKAAQAALEPLTRRYRAALEDLMKRATGARDLETAVKIKEELDAMAVNAPAVRTSSAPIAGSPEALAQAFEQRLVGTRWAFPVNDQPAANRWIRFEKDGVLSMGWWGDLKGAWKITGERQVEIRPWTDKSKVEVFRLDPSLRSGMVTYKNTGETKIERLER